MLRLNRVAAQVALASGAKGATDITGFGLIGHAAEMVEASAAGVEISVAQLPLLPGALALAEKGHFSGGMKRNRRHVEAIFGPRLIIEGTVAPALAALAFESETSGGLLFSVAPDRAHRVLDEFARHGESCAEIGVVLAEPVIRITR
jgi:selenide,water dikinase